MEPELFDHIELVEEERTITFDVLATEVYDTVITVFGSNGMFYFYHYFGKWIPVGQILPLRLISYTRCVGRPLSVPAVELPRPPPRGIVSANELGILQLYEIIEILYSERMYCIILQDGTVITELGEPRANLQTNLTWLPDKIVYRKQKLHVEVGTPSLLEWNNLAVQKIKFF